MADEYAEEVTFEDVEAPPPADDERRKRKKKNNKKKKKQTETDTSADATGGGDGAESIEQQPARYDWGSAAASAPSGAADEGEKAPLLVIESPGTHYEHLDRNLTYHVDVKRRVVVTAGSREVLEKPYKRMYWVSVVLEYFVLVLMGILNGALTIFFLYDFELPPAWLCIVLLVFNAIATVAAVLLVVRSFRASSLAAARIMNVSYRDTWEDKKYRGHKTGERLAPGWHHTNSHTELELSAGPAKVLTAVWAILVLPFSLVAIAIIVIDAL